MRKERTIDEIASGLRALADEFESGYRRVPTAGEGLRRIVGVPVVPVVVHDALCGWRVMSEQEQSEPRILACAGCGLGVLLADMQGRA